MNSALPDSHSDMEAYVDRFERDELRKVFYDVAIEKRKSGDIIEAIKILLLGWNWRAYAGRDVTNADLEDDFREVVENARPLIDYIESENLELASIDFDAVVDGRTVSTHIMTLYESLTEKDRIGETGASKALHVLSPDVFMMWDDAIIDEYHEPYTHRRASAACYFEFLQAIQEFILKELDESVFEKSATKLIDEYNYGKYTL